MKPIHALVAGLALAAAPAFAADASADKGFAVTAAEANMAEVATSQLAITKSRSEQTKKFAQHMVDEHTKATNELDQVAKSSGIEMPQRVSAKHKAAADHLQDLDGAKFDEAFAKQMVMDHEQAVALFQREAETGTDPGLKSYAQKMLPHLKEHLRMAKELAGQNVADTSKARRDR